MKKKISGIVILFVVLIAIFCKKSNDISDQSIDAITKSTEILNTENMADLPSIDGNYQIMGFSEGLKGYVVKYNDTLFRGGDILSEKGFSLLEKFKIKSIISVTPNEFIRENCEKLNISLFEFPYEYGNLAFSSLKQFLNIIDNVEYPVYIHCHGGNRRAGTLCTIFRIYKEGWSLNNALFEYGKLGGPLNKDYDFIKNIYNQIEN